MGLEKTTHFSMMVENILDEDLRGIWKEGDVLYDAVLLLQILRELKKEGPAEKTTPVRGFTGG